MRLLFKEISKMTLAGWMIWSCLFAAYEFSKGQIPLTIHLYEEEAKEVLSGTQKKIDPKDLYLDFAGNIEVSETADGNYQGVCHLLGVIPVKTMEISVVPKETLIPGGIPVGIYVQTEGVFVIGTGNVETDQGEVESPAKNIIKTGDYIVSIQGVKINRKEELIQELKNFKEEEVILGIRRNEESLAVAVTPVMKEDGAKIGVWVRDDTQGVGTLTYLTGDGKFGALGHGISDADSQLLMEVSGGQLYDCEIFDIIKGNPGNPGKVAGKIVYHQNNLYGEITGNFSGGIYGNANQHLRKSMKYGAMPMALMQEVEEGEAVILSSVDGELKEYRVEIEKIHKGEKDINRGMELVVTDERLLEITGGIVQGMSGSPIIQEGKLVGAVTHVLVNDPTRGYGIFIENMLDAAE